MDYRTFGNTIVARLERGEEIIPCIGEVCRREDVRLGQISGLGAVDLVRAGYFSLRENRFLSHEFQGEMEIVTLNGNITRKDGEPYLHLHIAVSRADGSMVGGHLDYGRVGPTAEIIITVIDGEVGRRVQEGTGINLIDFTGEE